MVCVILKYLVIIGDKVSVHNNKVVVARVVCKQGIYKQNKTKLGI